MIIIDSVKQLVSYDAGGIFLIDKNKKVLQRMVTRGYDTKLLKRLTLKLDRGLYGWVIKNRLPSIINDVSQDSNYYLVRKNTSSQLTVPLINGDQILGVMALESDKLNHFTPGDKELLMTFASQAVTAIENAQLFEAYPQKKRLNWVI
jgi:GAF domain-containing protein